MPRSPRIDQPGMLHHVMIRGIEKRIIFSDDTDRGAFLARLADSVDRCAVRCLSWALMANHVHMVVRTGDQPLARFMAGLNTSYALHFNRRHDRVGHLFQNRYRSRPIDDEDDLRRVVLYVAGNPLKDGVVLSEPQLRRYSWAAYGALAGQLPVLEFHAASEALQFFGPTLSAARTSIRKQMHDRTARWRGVEDPPERVHARDPGKQIDEFLDGLCVEFGVSRASLSAGRRTSELARVRAVAARRGRTLGLAASELAARLGVSDSGLRRAARRAVETPGEEVPN